MVIVKSLVHGGQKQAAASRCFTPKRTHGNCALRNKICPSFGPRLNMAWMADSPVKSGYVDKEAEPLMSQVGEIDRPTAWLTNPGSVKGSIFNLAAATLGAGALSLPYAFSRSGVGMGLLLLLLGVVLTIWTIRLLIEAGDLSGIYSYEKLSSHCFGARARVAVEVAIILFCIGTCVAYIVALGDILGPLFPEDSILSKRWFIMLAPTVGVILPLSLQRDMSSLQDSSLIGVVAIFFLVMAVATRSGQELHRNGIADNVEWTTSPSIVDVLLSVPIIMFAFTCQVNVFSIFTELQRRSTRRFAKVTRRAVGVCLTVYVTIGLTAYLAFGSQLADPKLKGDILLSFPIKDALIAVARAAMGLTVAIAFPLNVFPCRDSIVSLVCTEERVLSTVEHTVLTTSMVAVSLALAIAIPAINVVFGVVGGLCSSILCFILPAAYILKLREGPWFGRNKLGAWVLLVGGGVIGLTCTAITVWDTCT